MTEPPPGPSPGQPSEQPPQAPPGQPPQAPPGQPPRVAADRPPQRLSPLTPLVRSFIVLLAAGMTVIRDVTRGELGPTATLFVLLLLGGGLFGAVSWLRTTFWIESDELRVDTGVIQRQSRRIRIDRLQGIDIVQPFVARLFGLAELRMDVAGGSSREGSLAYLQLSEARRLKDLLLARRDELGATHRDAAAGEVGPAVAQGVAQGPAGEVAPAAPAPEQVIAHVNLSMLALSIVLSGETVALVLVMAGMVTAFVASGELVGLGAMVPVLFGFGIALFRRFSQNFRFTVSETPAGMQVKRGLFDLSAQTIALHRVQGVVVTEPLLWRALGWARLDVSIAGYGVGTDEGPAPSTVLPVGDRRVVHALARHVLGGLDPETAHLRPVPSRARWLAPVGFRFLRVGTTEHLVVSREGWFARRTHAAPQARVQSVRITQGPRQRLLGLADVHTDSPPGPTVVRARHRDAAEARRLFGVEVAMTAWARRQQR
ncbi:MAG TPA: PH domain-containing protein [Nocardioidaceae bacterium]|nr:PH domain-containing protein [Nocardioidaceae bacterium]